VRRERCDHFFADQRVRILQETAFRQGIGSFDSPADIKKLDSRTLQAPAERPLLPAAAPNSASDGTDSGSVTLRSGN
jgi:hypothetical protein